MRVRGGWAQWVVSNSRLFFLNFGSRNVVGHLEGVERGAWLAVVGVAECLFDVLIV